jgi:hypothetical protein
MGSYSLRMILIMPCAQLTGHTYFAMASETEKVRLLKCSADRS